MASDHNRCATATWCFATIPRDKLEDAIERYIPHVPIISEDFERYSVTRPEKSWEIELFENVTDEARNASENARKANKPGACDVVTEKRSRADGGELLEAANPLNEVLDERTRPPTLKLVAPAIEVVPGRELDPRPRLTRTIL
jgi:hypothetical protein